MEIIEKFTQSNINDFLENDITYDCNNYGRGYCKLESGEESIPLRELSVKVSNFIHANENKEFLVNNPDLEKKLAIKLNSLKGQRSTMVKQLSGLKNFLHTIRSWAGRFFHPKNANTELEYFEKVEDILVLGMAEDAKKDAQAKDKTQEAKDETKEFDAFEYVLENFCDLDSKTLDEPGKQADLDNFKHKIKEKVGKKLINDVYIDTIFTILLGEEKQFCFQHKYTEGLRSIFNLLKTKGMISKFEFSGNRARRKQCVITLQIDCLEKLKEFLCTPISTRL